jgi:membrane associated rhomboid family serine protease
MLVFLALVLAAVAGGLAAQPNAQALPELRGRLGLAALLALGAAWQNNFWLLAIAALLALPPLLLLLLPAGRRDGPAWIRALSYLPQTRRLLLRAWFEAALEQHGNIAQITPQPELEGQEVILAQLASRDHALTLRLDGTLAQPPTPALWAWRAQVVNRALDASGASNELLVQRLEQLRLRQPPAAAQDLALRLAARQGDDLAVAQNLRLLGWPAGSWLYCYWLARSYWVVDRQEEALLLFERAWQQMPRHGLSAGLVRHDIEGRLWQSGLQPVQATPRDWRSELARSPMTLGLLLLLTLVFAVTVAFDPNGALQGFSTEVLANLGGTYHQATIEQRQYWRLFTAVFLHGHLLHILMNGYALWSFGRSLERRTGPWLLLLVFLATGLAGSLASSLLGDQRALSVGASGAIFGLLGFASGYVPGSDLSLRLRQLSANASNIAITFLLGFVLPNVDQFAHGGGLVAGILLGLFWRLHPATANSQGQRAK